LRFGYPRSATTLVDFDWRAPGKTPRIAVEFVSRRRRTDEG
jgi:hypothetical protein